MNRVETMDPMVGEEGVASWDFRDCCGELQLCYATCHHGRKKIFDRLEGKLRCDQAYRTCARQHCVEATGGRGPHSDMCEGDVGMPPQRRSAYCRIVTAPPSAVHSLLNTVRCAVLRCGCAAGITMQALASSEHRSAHTGTLTRSPNHLLGS